MSNIEFQLFVQLINLAIRTGLFEFAALFFMMSVFVFMIADIIVHHKLEKRIKLLESKLSIEDKTTLQK